MSKPKAPKAPDPKEVAGAQTGQNMGTAIANTVMGQVNRVGPDGSLTYDQTDTYNWTDPNSGQVYNLPRYTATETLSDDAQELHDLNQRGSVAMGTLGAESAERLGGILGEDFDPSGLTARGDRSGFGPVNYSVPQDAPRLTLDERGMPSFGSISGDAGLQEGYQNDFSAFRSDMEGQLMDGLNVERGRDMEALRSQLMNQGVTEGSEAFTRAISDFDSSYDNRRLAAMRESLGATETMTGMARDEAGFANTARQAGLDNETRATQYGDQIQQLLFGLGSDQLAYNNSIEQQGFDNEGRILARDDATKNANFNESRILADDQNRDRANELDEAFALRAQPVNEIAALLSGTQVNSPNFAIAQPYAAPTTDIAGITQQGFANQMGVYGEQNANWREAVGGLFGLGGSAITAGAV